MTTADQYFEALRSWFDDQIAAGISKDLLPTVADLETMARELETLTARFTAV